VAHSLLQDILQKSFPDAAGYKKYWAANKGLTLQQRWYRQLADDQAGVDAWNESASLIVRPSNVKYISGWWETSPKEKAGLSGESLRTNTGPSILAPFNPSVSELLAKRAIEIFPKNFADAGASTALDWAGNFARILAMWDGAAARPVLKEQMRRCIEASSQPNVPME